MTFQARAGRGFTPFAADGLPVPIYPFRRGGIPMVLSLVKLGTKHADRVGAREAFNNNRRTAGEL